jgi:selenocysteine-specific elongation factor
VRGLILGTAGHIDHGKSALVRALTGVDPDRLPEEKERGITIELGFAELELEDGLRFGVVDVPGHEAFVRAMVAGAAGVDAVLLIVAADEGVMPQTREHLAIVELLGVSELVVALTKCDLVDEDWLELVEADVAELLSGTPYEGAPQMRTSATRETGLDRLRHVLRETAARIDREGTDDLARLPLDRVFTMQGTGTVVTGTLWSGEIRTGDRVRIVPQDLPARVRGVQVHGRDVPAARSGDRTAVALTGDGADRARVERGATLVTSQEWIPSHMLTARVRMLDGTEWMLEHNQRVHVHHGTSEVLARCALLEEGALGPGDGGWVQFRLEEPLAARARDRFVIRAYSPVTTIGGGAIAEVAPPKRRRIDEDVRAGLTAILDGSLADAISAVIELGGWTGITTASLPIHTGLSRTRLEDALAELDGGRVLRASETLFGAHVRAEAESTILEAVARGHAADPLRAAVPMSDVRAALPRWAASQLAPPLLDELPAELTDRSDFGSLLRRLEQSGTVHQVADGFYLMRDVLDEAVARVREQLAGRTDLGPSDFREVLPVSRKWLIPLLNYLDGQGVTVRRGGGRDVPEAD